MSVYIRSVWTIWTYRVSVKKLREDHLSATTTSACVARRGGHFWLLCWCFSGFWLTLYANNGRVLPKEPRIQQTPRLCQRLSGWNSKHLHIKYNTPTLTQINTADKLPENIHFSLYTPWLVLNGCLTGVKCLQCVGMKWGWGGQWHLQSAFHL